MIIESCPKRGLSCVSMTASIVSPIRVTVLAADILDTKELEMPANVLITPMRHVLQILKETSQTLERINHHPPDNSVVGIRTELLESLQVVLARAEGNQRRVDSQNVAEDTRVELDLAKAAAVTMAPLAQEYAKRTLRAEDFVLPLQECYVPT